MARSGHVSPTSLDGFTGAPVNGDVRVEVFDELHGSHEVTRLEQGLKLGVERMVKGDGALRKGSQLLLATRREGEQVPDRDTKPALSL